MSSTRQDAWSQDEDLFLAEIVLRNIREGGTQLQAFEEVGRQLKRTAAACGFRWNSYVRKQYKSGIELAKKQRKSLKKSLPQEARGQKQPELSDAAIKEEAFDKEAESHSGTWEFDTLITYLKKLHDKAEKKGTADEEANAYEDRIKQLEKQMYYLAAENEKLMKELSTMEQDYKALIEIMERARKLVVLKEEDREKNVRFQMDLNGNLEKIEK